MTPSALQSYRQELADFSARLARHRARLAMLVAHVDQLHQLRRFPRAL
jgi:hypothetical protein